MYTIVPQTKLFDVILNSFDDRVAKFKKSIFAYEIDVDNGVLVYNTLTHELLFLTNEEAKILRNLDNSKKIFFDLVKKRIIVDSKLNEYILCRQIKNFSLNLNTKKGINSYVILTTTDCNARCPYCYEKDIKRTYMSSETADKLVDYISLNYNMKQVALHWFGGEPLCNIKVIDEICEKLAKNQIPFKSTMVSNGYLFDDAIITHAIEKWHFEKVQITLDGTENIYNQTKNYIYNNENAFKKVMRNIHLLIDNGIKVAIRLNVTKDNVTDLYSLVNYLHDSLKNKSLFYVYTGIVEDYDNIENIWGTEERRNIINLRNDLEKHIFDLGLKKSIKIGNTVKIMQCMAENPWETVVAPDGKLYKCEHVLENESYGSLYDQEQNIEIINAWKIRPNDFDLCQTCAYLPECNRIKKCPAFKNFLCDKYEQELKMTDIKYAALNTYNYFLKTKK